MCYFVNLLLLLTVWVAPRSKRLFISTYCLAYGNNAVAIAMWRNSVRKPIHDLSSEIRWRGHIWSSWEMAFTAISFHHYFTPLLNIQLTLFCFRWCSTPWTKSRGGHCIVRNGKPQSADFLQSIYTHHAACHLALSRPPDTLIPPAEALPSNLRH